MNNSNRKTKEFEQGFKLFLNYIERTKINLDNQQNIYIYYSGGKDASLLSDFFLKYKEMKKFEFNIVLLTIRYPSIIYDSSNENQREKVNEAINYWTSKGIIHRWMEVEDVNDSLLAESDTPCSICEKAKIRSMDKEMGKEEFANALICLGHTLDDITGYFSELFYIAGAYSGWETIREENPILFKRILEISRWVYLTYSPYGLLNQFMYLKPLMFMEEKLIRKITFEEKYPLIPECCSEFMGEKFMLYKRIVNRGINWLDKQYENESNIYNNLLYKNYDTMLKAFQHMDILPPLKYIESIKI